MVNFCNSEYLFWLEVLSDGFFSELLQDIIPQSRRKEIRYFKSCFILVTLFLVVFPFLMVQKNVFLFLYGYANSLKYYRVQGWGNLSFQGRVLHAQNHVL